MMAFLAIPACLLRFILGHSERFVLPLGSLDVALVLPVGYVAIARRIADRRIVLAGHRLADLLARLPGN